MKLSQYLYVFNHIRTKGIKTKDVYYNGDLFAWHDIDGYTCYLGYKDLTLTLYFHGKHAYEYQDKKTLKKFEQLVKKVLEPLAVNEE